MNQSTGTPITPEWYRVLADDVQHTVDNGYEFAPENIVAALRAAAEEVDRLQADLSASVASEEAATSQVFDLLDNRARLRAVIKNAPHEYDCQLSPWLRNKYGWESCTCWKADGDYR